MRKLSELEEGAYLILCREGSVLIGHDDLRPHAHQLMTDVLDALVKKKRAVVEVTDGGNRYHAR